MLSTSQDLTFGADLNHAMDSGEALPEGAELRTGNLFLLRPRCKQEPRCSQIYFILGICNMKTAY